MNKDPSKSCKVVVGGGVAREKGAGGGEELIGISEDIWKYGFQSRQIEKGHLLSKLKTEISFLYNSYDLLLCDGLVGKTVFALCNPYHRGLNASVSDPQIWFIIHFHRVTPRSQTKCTSIK